MLYLAARNEHIENKIKPALKNKKIVICDRFIDSTYSYQVYGKKVNKNLIDTVHKYILGNLKPNLTFVLKMKISKALIRIKNRRTKNRYDKFSKSFYIKAQNAFLKIAKKNKSKYKIFDNSNDDNKIHNKILKIVEKKIN